MPGLGARDRDTTGAPGWAVRAAGQAGRGQRAQVHRYPPPKCTRTYMLTQECGHTHILSHTRSRTHTQWAQGQKNRVVFSSIHVPTLKKTGRDLGPGTGRGSGLHTGSRLQPGGTQGQTDRWLPGGEVECAHRGSTPQCWSCLRAPQASPLTYPVEKPRQGWLVPVPREGRRSWPWTQAHLISHSPSPWSCSPTWKWPRWSPLPASPGALVGLFLQPCCSSSTGHTRGTWPGLWWSRGAP